MMGVWAIMKSTAMNILIHVCISTAVKLLGHKICTSSALEDNAKQYSMVVSIILLIFGYF